MCVINSGPFYSPLCLSPLISFGFMCGPVERPTFQESAPQAGGEGGRRGADRFFNVTFHRKTESRLVDNTYAIYEQALMIWKNVRCRVVSLLARRKQRQTDTAGAWLDVFLHQGARGEGHRRPWSLQDTMTRKHLEYRSRPGEVMDFFPLRKTRVDSAVLVSNVMYMLMCVYSNNAPAVHSSCI